MNIGIPLKKSAYTPEAYAYKEYLTKLGWNVQLDFKLDPNNDINLMFMGIEPFWNKRVGRAKVIHEYQSLSVPPYSNLKDIYKKNVNKTPAGRIFLNNIVSSKFDFKDKIPYIFRDMGVDEIFFQPPSNVKLYDIVYCGSINRVGLLDCITKLARNGYKIIIVGYFTEGDKKIFSNFNNVTFYGPATRLEISDIYKNCRYGLNFTPDIFPLNVQTSTKTLEYLASGLIVISNKYEWSINFSKKYNIIWLEDFFCKKEIKGLNSSFDTFLFKKEYSWDSILKVSKFDSFLIDLM